VLGLPLHLVPVEVSTGRKHELRRQNSFILKEIMELGESLLDYYSPIYLFLLNSCKLLAKWR
jgi:hypothetical protein